MSEGRYILAKDEQILWEGYTVKGANLKEKGTEIRTIWIYTILVIVSVVLVVLARIYVFLFVGFFSAFAIIANLGYQCGKFIITNKRILWGKRSRTGMMYYMPITRKCSLICYKSDRNVGFVKCVKKRSAMKERKDRVYIRGVENPEQVCSILQSVIDSMS